ncbi:MAG: MBL fold metallo-hydrolase [Gammaproteobacteria bacterium]|nr:MBL fold metallo-hydrolase [Gammaproteobacteria bacterium]
MADDGIRVRILGDSGPFSRMGKSISYLLEIGTSKLLIDCGAPMFQLIGGRALKNIRGLFVTHCHDDHKRWFTDMALFYRYAPDFAEPLTLLTTDDVQAELERASGPSLDISLSPDARRIVDLPVADYYKRLPVGPRAKYRIDDARERGGPLAVVDRDGTPVDPERAKVVVSPATRRPRLLFRDPETEAWVEPAAYYAFTDPCFYEADPRLYRDPEGFTIEAINAPVWHGLPTVGLRVRYGDEVLIFPSDTNHDLDLWQALVKDRRMPTHGMAPDAFAAARVLEGDINDFVERTWSERRYEEALATFSEGVSIHDVSGPRSVVHTGYDQLRRTALDPARTLLTHSPDRMTSAWTLSKVDKTFCILDGRIHEQVGDAVWPMCADYYHKENGRYYVAYRDAEGTHVVQEKNGMLSMAREPMTDRGEVVCRVRVYEDVNGKYLPLLDPGDGAVYRQRDDGHVERVETHAEGSVGRVVADLREEVTREALARRE